MRTLLLIALIVGVSSPVSAQQLPRNPRGVGFICPDHDRDDGHELDIVDRAMGQVIQTLDLGDPPRNAAGVVEASVNVQPFDFGVYAFVVRAKAGTIESEDSEAWVWERAPGRPVFAQ